MLANLAVIVALHCTIIVRVHQAGWGEAEAREHVDMTKSGGIGGRWTCVWCALVDNITA